MVAANATTKPKYALYTRISKDPNGESTAPARQEKECKALAKERGFVIADVYSDVDLSAYTDVIRPQYEAMLEAMAADAYDGVIVWKLDRLVRRAVEFWRFWTIADTHKVALVSKSDQFIDTTSPIGRGVVGLIVSLAEQESYNTGLRLQAKERERAEAGLAKHSGTRAYGTRTIIDPESEKPILGAGSYDEIDEVEAAVIRDAAERFLAGETLSSIVADLNARGITAAQGGRWTKRSLHNLLRQARLFGWRELHGELIAKGTWPAILDEDTGRKLRKLLPAVAKGTAGPMRRHLLSGLLKCGKCNHNMKASSSGGSATRYACPSKEDGGCGGCTIDREKTNEAITEMVLYRLDSPDFAAVLKARQKGRSKGDKGKDAELLAELAAIADRSTENAIEFANGDLPVKAFANAERELEARAQLLNEQLATIRQDERLPQAGGIKGLVETWDQMEVPRQRAVIDALIEKIVVHHPGDPWYDALMKDTLEGELAQHVEEGARLRVEATKLAAAGKTDEAVEMRRRAARQAQQASRKRAAARKMSWGGSVFRPERLEPVWRV